MGSKSKSIIPTGLKLGDYVLVYWLDIVGSHSEDKAKAELATCITGGFYQGFKTSRGKRSLITLDTWHPIGYEDTPYEGYDIYPVSVILRVQKIFSGKDIKWPT